MNKNLYVGNLSFKVTDDDLRSNFSEAGEVASAAIIKDKFTGQSKGFGFVEMKTEEGAAEAVKKFHGGMLDGKAITVNEARPKKEYGCRWRWKPRRRRWWFPWRWKSRRRRWKPRRQILNLLFRQGINCKSQMGVFRKTHLRFFYCADSTYSTIFSAMVLTIRSYSVSSLSSSVMRKPGRGVKNEVNGTTQIPVAPRR